MVERALRIYGGDHLELPPRQDLVNPLDPSVLVIGDERVPIGPDRGDNTAVLADYVAAVRRQRGLEPAAVVRFRSNDLVQLATVLDLTSTDLEDRLRRITGLDRDPAVQAARRLVLTGLALAIVGETRETRETTASAWTPSAAGLRLYEAQRSATAAPVGPDSRGDSDDRDDPPDGVASAPGASWLSRDPATPAVDPLAQIDALAELVARARTAPMPPQPPD